MPKEKLNNAEKRELGRKNPRGEEISKIAHDLGVSKSTVYRGKKEGILQNQKEDLIQGLLDGSLNLAVKFKNVNEK